MKASLPAAGAGPRSRGAAVGTEIAFRGRAAFEALRLGSLVGVEAARIAGAGRDDLLRHRSALSLPPSEPDSSGDACDKEGGGHVPVFDR